MMKTVKRSGQGLRTDVRKHSKEDRLDQGSRRLGQLLRSRKPGRNPAGPVSPIDEAS
jgi:hypothetical protein